MLCGCGLLQLIWPLHPQDRALLCLRVVHSKALRHCPASVSGAGQREAIPQCPVGPCGFAGPLSFRYSRGLWGIAIHVPIAL